MQSPLRAPRVSSTAVRFLLLFMVLLAPASAFAQQMALIPAPTLKVAPARPRGEDATMLLERQLTSGAIVLLGDTHQNGQILSFLSQTLPALARKGALTHLALEIGSDQQAAIDQFLSTGKGLDDIQLLPAIEYDAYREMLRSLRKAQRRGKHLQVRAIDAPRRLGEVNRDAYMAGKLTELRTTEPDARILVLVGNIHAIKGVTWAGGMPARFIPDYLRAASPEVKTFSIHQCVASGLPDEVRTVLGPQVRPGSRPRAYAATHPTLSRLQDDTLSILNLEPGHGLEDEVDGVIYYPDP